LAAKTVAELAAGRARATVEWAEAVVRVAAKTEGEGSKGATAEGTEKEAPVVATEVVGEIAPGETGEPEEAAETA
jgi:hypothetical protein